MEIKTERLKLVELTMADWKNYVVHVLEADEIFVQYGVEPDDESIEAIHLPTEEVTYLTVRLAENDEMIGYVGVTEERDNMEFYIFKEYRRNGYGTEAVAAFTAAYLSGELTGNPHGSAEAVTFHNNEASIGLLEKAGYEKEAVGFRLFSAEEEEDPVVEGIVRYVVGERE